MKKTNAERLDHVTYLRVPRPVFKRLKKVAAAEDRPVSYIVRQAIEVYLGEANR